MDKAQKKLLGHIEWLTEQAEELHRRWKHAKEQSERAARRLDQAQREWGAAILTLKHALKEAGLPSDLKTAAHDLEMIGDAQRVTIADLAVQILMEQGALSSAQIVRQLRLFGKFTNTNTVTATLNRYKDTFVRDEEGEWTLKEDGGAETK